MAKYQHLNNAERYFIYSANRVGMHQKEIAECLERSPSTICRELKRNKYPERLKYHYHDALRIVRSRKRKVIATKARKITREIGDLIEQLMQEYLSPEQVCGYLAKHHDFSLSHQSVYQYIYSDEDRVNLLRPFLRQGKKPRRKRYGSARKPIIPNRTCISQRPAIVEKKERIGDWECDTIVGSDRKHVLVTVVDRATLFTCCARANSKTAQAVSDTLVRLLMPYKDRVKTLTFDNGTEFVQHQKVGKALNATTYFAHPYSSWERPINENTNGLLRQFFPKKTDFSQIGWRDIKTAVKNLNNRPRKTRDFKTPNQLFNGIIVPLT